MDLAALLTTFALILPAELPDKTFVATLVLSTRFPPLRVWIGVSAAFAIQSLVAVTAGGLLALLPRTPVLLVTAGLFILGAVVTWRGASHAAEDAAEEEAEVARKTMTASRRRAIVTSFVVLFAAEWGDLSQLLTAGLAARFDAPAEVFLGSWLALASVAALGVLLGRALMRRLPLATIRRGSAVLLAVLAGLTLLETAHGLLR